MSHKLLLADDSASIRRVIELTFADEDIEVVSAGTGEQALEAMSQDAPDIILVDAGLPGTDGYGVASFVRNDAALARIPVVLLTGAFEPLDESRAAAAGCRDVLVKPFAPRQVIDKVRELLGPGPAAAATHAAGETAPAEAAPVESGAETAGAETGSAETGSAETEPGAALPEDAAATDAAAPEADSPAGGAVSGVPAGPAESATAETVTEVDIPDAPAEATATAEPAAHLPTATAPESTAQPFRSGASVLARAFAEFLAAERAATTPADSTREASSATSASEASGPAAGGEHGPASGAS